MDVNKRFHPGWECCLHPHSFLNGKFVDAAAVDPNRLIVGMLTFNLEFQMKRIRWRITNRMA